jgi:arabinogalactan oligomer/maltooligosaccharide transport system substrate-binding protein
MYYRKDLLPADWKTVWDDNKNEVPDMLENWNKMYEYSIQVHKANPSKWGYMRSFLEPYFSAGYLFSYGAYAFGKDDTDQDDIGFSKGEAEKGAWVIRQLASIMNENCIDDTITVTAYSQLAKGNFFATITTPDVYTLFIEQMRVEGMSEAKAKENLGISTIPDLPVSGDLSEKNPELIPSKMMGGVQGYAISSYTKYPNASLAFVNFATNYQMIKTRNELLGIVPARQDVAEEVGGLSEIIYNNLEQGYIQVMPSIRATAQIWTPLTTLFQDIAKDAFRTGSDIKYKSPADLKPELEKTDKNIYDAIHTLQ